MFLDPVVILVGAGASAEFGIPTGIGIYQDAKSESEKRRSSSGGMEERFFSSFWEFLRFNNLGPAQHDFRALVQKLQESHASSIDLFAYYNPSNSDIAKLFTTWRIVKEHFVSGTVRDQWGDRQKVVLRSDAWLQPTVGSGDSTRNNWMGELVNTLLSGAKDPSDLRKSGLSIITFNYDTIIEQTIPWIIGRYERFAETPSKYLPRVTHVHGSIESIDVDHINVKYYLEQAKSVKFISDSLEHPSEAVNEARRLLMAANRVYCVGFAFEPLNLELLGVENWGEKAVALNFDGNVKVANAMKKAGLRSSDIWSGTDAKPLPLGLAASRGFFDARPGQ